MLLSVNIDGQLVAPMAIFCQSIKVRITDRIRAGGRVRIRDRVRVRISYCIWPRHVSLFVCLWYYSSL